MLEFTTSKLWVVGDTHGYVRDISDVDQKGVREGIKLAAQAGDFGVRWDWASDRYFQKRAWQGREGMIWITVGGNHENYDRWQKLQRDQNFPELVELWPGVYWAPRPTLILINGEKFLFMGGGNSIDRHLRTEGKDWWSYEQPTAEEMRNFFNMLNDEKPEFVVTHEAPSRVHFGPDKRLSHTAIDFDNILDHTDHMPKVWYYGHHHHRATVEFDGTDFVCCGWNGQYVVHGE